MTSFYIKFLPLKPAAIFLYRMKQHRRVRCGSLCSKKAGTQSAQRRHDEHNGTTDRKTDMN